MNNNDAEFIKLDEELYKAIQNVVTKSSLIKEFEINADSHIFNAYCELRNAIFYEKEIGGSNKLNTKFV